MCTVGYGDLPPKTRVEKVFVIVVMFLSSGIYAFTIDKISKMVKQYNELATEYREKMTFVR